MEMSPDRFIGRLQKAHRCQPDVRQVAKDMECLTPGEYDELASRLIERGEDHALGILLNVAAVNKIAFDPSVLAEVLKVVDVIIDIRHPYNYQCESAIEPLLAVALSEELSYERQAFAAGLAVELALKFSYPKQPVKKVLWELMEKISYGEGRLLLDAALDLLERGDEGSNSRFRLIGGDVLSELPAEPPPVIIGDGGTVRRPVKKLGRNDPCRCGSGKKYKKCCYNEDQLRMRDASAYSGVTKSQLRENPGLVDDASYITDLRPYELKKLVPSRMNDAQLLAAYRRADIFGLREVALEMLSELKSRPGKEELAVEHMCDLFYSALTAQDMETIRKLSPHIPEKDRYFSGSDRLKHELLEKPDKFRDLEALCIKAFANNEDHCLLELSYAFEDILPALSIVFGRAAIVSEPERKFDNEILIDAMRKRRIALDLEPWGDPIEDYWDWIMGRDPERIAEEDKDERIKKLQEQLSEAREKSSLALKDLQGKEKALAELEKKLQGVTAVAPLEDVLPTGKPTKNDTMAEEDGEERKQAIVALKSKIEALKMEIRSQQEAKLRLRKKLHDAHEIISKQRDQKAPSQEMPDSEADFLPPVPEKVRIPDFTTSFRKSCENLPSALVVKAMQAAVGFASRDKAILRQTLGIERMPDYYRVKVGIHHRLIIHQKPGNELQVVELIPRKQLETWIRKHTS